MLSSYSSSFCRKYTHFEILESLRDSAKAAAAGFVDEGMKAFYNRWSINIFNEGSTIKDEKKFQEFQHRIVDEIDAIKRQATIQQMYKNVKIE
mgnify:CR=1 FL=1